MSIQSSSAHIGVNADGIIDMHDSIPELADVSVIAHWRAAHRLSRWLTRRSPGRPRRHPGWYGLRWEPLDCHSADGLRLAGWLIEPRGPRGTILLFHGLRRNRDQVLGWAAALVQLGYRIVAIDFRAHGESEGWRTSFGWWERFDVQAVADQAAERWPGQPCVAMGLDLGAAAISFAGCPCDACIVQAVPERLSRLFEQALLASPPTAAGFLHKVKDVTERRLGVRLEDVIPAEHLARLAMPVLVLPASRGFPQAAQEVGDFLRRWL